MTRLLAPQVYTDVRVSSTPPYLSSKHGIFFPGTAGQHEQAKELRLWESASSDVMGTGFPGKGQTFSSASKLSATRTNTASKYGGELVSSIRQR